METERDKKTSKKKKGWDSGVFRLVGFLFFIIAQLEFVFNQRKYFPLIRM